MTLYAEVIGDPIAHSKSPLIHSFWLKKLGIEAQYRTCHVRADGLADYIENRQKDSNWRGCNVTIPHKIAVMDHVNDPGDIKSSIGAMNTIFRQDDRLIGTNSDAGGFYAPIAGDNWKGKHALLIGAGGAARAILFALSKAEIGRVTILARNALKAMGLLAQFGLKGEILPMDAALPPVDLLVNSSPLGMQGQEPLHIDLNPLPEDAIIYDIVYTPLKTELLKQARVRQLLAIDGLDMLIGQAAIGFELFFGAPPPPNCEDELRNILIAAL